VESIHEFHSYDGTVLHGTFAGSRNGGSPLVVMVHGITSSRDELGLFSGFAAHLERTGLPSFRFDYRCHGVNVGSIETMTLTGIVNDIEAAASFASRYASASHIHVVGMSFGGGLAAYWAAMTKVTVSSVIMLAPVIDYEEDVLGQYGLLQDGTLHSKAKRQLDKHGFVKTGGIKYGRSLINELPYISGVVGLHRLQCKVLIVHGDADSIVPYAQSLKYVKYGIHCRLVNIPGTDHGFGIPGDDDLSSPETKAKHKTVYELATAFMNNSGAK
jgi:uncharacterized protein